MTLRFKTNLCAGVAGLLFGAVVYYLVPLYIGMEYGSDQEMITSRTMPYAVAILSIVCGLALIFQSVVLKKDTVKQVQFAQEAKALFFMAALILYCFIFQYGFILSTSYIGVASLIFSKSKSVYHYVVVVGTVLLLYWVFTAVLLVRLP